MNKEDFYELGYIAKVHGTRGEVLVEIDTDHPQHYKNLKSLFLEHPNGQVEPYFIEKIQIRATQKTAIIKFEEVSNEKDAFALRGNRILLPLDKLPILGEGHFYYHEIIGFKVVDENEGVVGTASGVYELPNNVLLAIDHDGIEVLMPLLDPFLSKVDKLNKVIHVKMPEGLVDVYTQKQIPDDGIDEEI
jgi:16S rRNA processing protein RimM